MKHKFYLAFLLFFALTKINAQSGLCDTAYWNHTYANERLRIYDSCYTITGTIYLLLPPSFTGDGDYHIYVQVDTPYVWMLNYRDSTYLKSCLGLDSAGYHICNSCLNVEEVCKGTITDGGADGMVENAACYNFNDTVYLPNTGEHVRATGPFVYDTVHCWNELHPISKMEVITNTGIAEPSSSVINSLKVFPQPASNIVAFEFDAPPHALTFIKLYNIKGQQLYVYAMSETNLLNLDVTSWPSGEYLYKVASQESNKTLKSGKFTVVH